jgi:nitrate/nitrite transporter NarK
MWPFIINAPLWMTQVFLVVYGQNITYSQRVIPGFIIMSVCMIIIPILCQVGSSTGFYTTDVMLFILGIASGMCQGTVYQMAAAFPPEYMAAVMFGNGLSGFGTVCLRAVTILIWPSDESDQNEFKGALALYIFAFFVLALCALSMVCVRKNNYYVYYLKKTEHKVEDVQKGMKGEEEDVMLV